MGAAELLKVDSENFKKCSADLVELYIISVQEYLKRVLPDSAGIYGNVCI